MRNIAFIILLFSIIFYSCNGKMSKKQSLSNSVAEFKIHNTIEQSVYYPESYREFKSDTLLSNGYRIKITNFTNMQKNHIEKEVSDIEILKKHYREINSEIVVFDNNEKIFDKTIDSSSLSKKLNNSKDIAKHILIRGVWVNEYESVISNSIILDVEYMSLEDKKSNTCKLQIQKNGDYNFITT